jgi:GTPase SAR1 family protein
MSKHMEVRLAVVGLSRAGKSTLVEQLAQEDGNRTFITTTPTTPDEGRMELHEPSDTMRMMIWDMNGRVEARRATWYDQIERCDAVMYVFDCGDLTSLDGTHCLEARICSLRYCLHWRLCRSERRTFEHLRRRTPCRSDATAHLGE